MCKCGRLLFARNESASCEVTPEILSTIEQVGQRTSLDFGHYSYISFPQNKKLKLRSRSLPKATEMQPGHQDNISFSFVWPLGTSLQEKVQEMFLPKEQPHGAHFEEQITTQTPTVWLDGLFNERISKHTEAFVMMQVLQGILDEVNYTCAIGSLNLSHSSEILSAYQSLLQKWKWKAFTRGTTLLSRTGDDA